MFYRIILWFVVLTISDPGKYMYNLGKIIGIMHHFFFLITIVRQKILINIIHYMAGPMNSRDDVNPALRLATRVGKMGLSCPLGIARDFPANLLLLPPLLPHYKSFVEQACSAKKAGYWPRTEKKKRK